MPRDPCDAVPSGMFSQHHWGQMSFCLFLCLFVFQHKWIPHKWIPNKWKTFWQKLEEKLFPKDSNPRLQDPRRVRYHSRYNFENMQFGLVKWVPSVTVHHARRAVQFSRKWYEWWCHKKGAIRGMCGGQLDNKPQHLNFPNLTIQPPTFNPLPKIKMWKRLKDFWEYGSSKMLENIYKPVS